MKNLLAICASGIVAVSGAQAATSFKAKLTGDQEVPPSGSPHRAVASMKLVDPDSDGALDALDIVVEFPPAFNFGSTGMTDDNGGSQTVTVFHIHAAPRGSVGGVVFGIIGPNSDLDGDRMFTLLGDGSVRVVNQWDLGEGNAGRTLREFIGAMTSARAGDELALYFNLHTTAFPGGEIRGQIAAVPVPAALPLFGGVLAVSALARRMRRTR